MQPKPVPDSFFMPFHDVWFAQGYANGVPEWLLLTSY
jgi:hypothetical protein